MTGDGSAASDASSSRRRRDPEGVRTAGDRETDEDLKASGRDPEELLVLARRCPACSSWLNVRVTAALRELLQETAEPKHPIGTVLCNAYHHPQGPCGELVELSAADIQQPGGPEPVVCPRVDYVAMP